MMIFFDLDDTLFERMQPFLKACREYLDLHDKELIRKAYKAVSKRGDEVFEMSQRGEMSMRDMYIYRCCKGFQDAGVSITPDMALAFTDVYKEAQSKITLADEVREVLDRLKDEGVPMGIISNGQHEHQWVKIKALRLTKWIDPELILITGDLGIDKPNLDVFRIAEERAKVSGDQCVMVGDSFDKDIVPAHRRGWGTVFCKDSLVNLSLMHGILKDSTEKKEALLEQMLLDYPVFEYAFGDTKDIPFSDKVIQICRNDCDRYGHCWACPPHAGNIPDNMEKVQKYERFLIFSTINEVADAGIFDQCMEAKRPHENLTREFTDRLLAEWNTRFYCLSAGCMICESCACPDEPCRHPFHRLMTTESHGIVLMQLVEQMKMSIYSGGNEIPYYSMILF